MTLRVDYILSVNQFSEILLATLAELTLTPSKERHSLERALQRVVVYTVWWPSLADWAERGQCLCTVFGNIRFPGKYRKKAKTHNKLNWHDDETKN